MAFLRSQSVSMLALAVALGLATPIIPSAFALEVIDDVPVNVVDDDSDEGPEDILAGDGTETQSVTVENRTVGAAYVSPNGEVVLGAGAVAQRIAVGGGRMTVRDGAKVNPGGVYAGGSVYNNGNLTITGAGTEYFNTSGFAVASVGLMDRGVLSLLAGAHMTTGFDPIGNSFVVAGPGGSRGYVLVDGAGTQLTAAGLVALGAFGDASMDVTNGALVRSAGGLLGILDSGVGRASISNATWDARGGILGIGLDGTGELLVARNGRVIADAIIVGGAPDPQDPTAVNDGTGTLSIGARAGEAPAAPGVIVAPSIELRTAPSKLVFNHTGKSYRFNTPISGAGSVEFLAGSTFLGGSHTYTGNTRIGEGATLEMQNNSTSLASSTTVERGATLIGRGHINANVANAGALRVGDHSFTITGRYQSEGGEVHTYAALGKTGSRASILRVGETEMGSAPTRLFVKNVGGKGAPDAEILIVDVLGGPSKSAKGVFELAHRAAAGAYEYKLVRDEEDGDWKLRSAADKPRVEVPVFASVPDLVRGFDFAMLGNSDARRATLPFLGDSGVASGFGWGRVFGATGSQNGDLTANLGPTFKYTGGGAQAGLNLLNIDGASGTGTGGFYVGYGSASGDVKEATDRLLAGRMELDAFSGGLYYRHTFNTGLWLEGVVQGTSYDVSSSSVLGQSSGAIGWSTAASIEAGMPFAFANGWTIEPQAQFVVQSISLGDLTDNYGRATIDDQTIFTGRIGGKASRSFMLDNGMQVDLFARASLISTSGEFGNVRITDLNSNYPVSYKAGKGGLSTEIEAGVALKLPKVPVTAFAAVSYKAGLTGGRRGDDDVGGKIGVQLKF